MKSFVKQEEEVKKKVQKMQTWRMKKVQLKMTWIHVPCGPWVGATGSQSPSKVSLCLVDLSEDAWRSELWCLLHPEDWLCGKFSQSSTDVAEHRSHVLYSVPL